MEKANIPMPGDLKYWTADEVAECLDYGRFLPNINKKGQVRGAQRRELHTKLWGFLNAAENATPLGGDGSNGTVETPDGRLDLGNDDKAAHWWKQLTPTEATAIAMALHVWENNI
jgi:hypothetical protein